MVTIGPLAVPNEVFAGLLAFLGFTILVSLAARRVDQKLEAWSTLALVTGLIVARTVYVALNWATFSSNPLRALMLWQGGFEWVSGLVAALVSSFFIIRSWRSQGVAIAILLASTCVWIAAQTLLDDTKEGLRLPDVTLTQADGADIRLHEYESGPLVINMWATWCPPCRRELPAMAAQAAASPSVPFLLVNQAEEPGIVQAYLQQQSLTLDHVLFDTGAELALAVHTVGIPITLFFFDGVMMDMHAGEISPEALRKKTEALIKNR